MRLCYSYNKTVKCQVSIFNRSGLRINIGHQLFKAVTSEDFLLSRLVRLLANRFSIPHGVLFSPDPFKSENPQSRDVAVGPGREVPFGRYAPVRSIDHAEKSADSAFLSPFWAPPLISPSFNLYVTVCFKTVNDSASPPVIIAGVVFRFQGGFAPLSRRFSRLRHGYGEEQLAGPSDTLQRGAPGGWRQSISLIYSWGAFCFFSLLGRKGWIISVGRPMVLFIIPNNSEPTADGERAEIFGFFKSPRTRTG